MPTKKKKATAAKKEEPVGALTEEERLVLAQGEALKAEEAEISANEQRLSLLRAQRLDEHRRWAKNEKAIVARWLVIMRQAKSEELRNSAKIAAQRHAQQIDLKNALLKNLQQDLDDHEVQHRFAVGAHVTQVNDLLRLHDQRQREQSDWFASDARTLADSFSDEAAEITQRHAKQKRDMLDVLDAMAKTHDLSSHHQRAAFETSREEIKSKNAEEFDVARAKLEKTVLACEKICEDAHKAYVSGTDTRSASFEQLTRLDSASAKLIESRMRDLGSLARKVRAMKGAMKASALEWRAKNKALRKETESVRGHAYALSNETKTFRKAQDTKLKLVLNCSNAALTKLDEKLIHAERVLKLAAAARRLETDRERVAPFGDDSVWVNSRELAELEDREGVPVSGASPSSGLTVHTLADDAVDEDELLSTGAVCPATNAAVAENNYLDRFFTRVNKVFLDERAASNETERLTQENDDLKRILTDYLNGTTVNETVLADPNNPLFVVNDRVLIAQRNRRDAETKAIEQQKQTARHLYNSQRRGGYSRTGTLQVEGSRVRSVSGGARGEPQVAAAPVEVFVNAN